ncbi:hypothetical protein KQX54_013726 [Cotesia glomerata]|uniref:Uncharacterized protein n=1 Tax=Cotesia glomerata TaxID=32391 RepID=A0AAV7J4X7_COTGL|nr:hypothetical protein KQX54_013726 [Cotesia glomerata]
MSPCVASREDRTIWQYLEERDRYQETAVETPKTSSLQENEPTVGTPKTPLQGTVGAPAKKRGRPPKHPEKPGGIRIDPSARDYKNISKRIFFTKPNEIDFSNSGTGPMYLSVQVVNALVNAPPAITDG